LFSDVSVPELPRHSKAQQSTAKHSHRQQSYYTMNHQSFLTNIQIPVSLPTPTNSILIDNVIAFVPGCNSQAQVTRKTNTGSKPLAK
jgi:hypothetical protein